MLTELRLTGTFDALVALAASAGLPVTADTLVETCRAAAPAADPRTLTWPELLAVAGRLGFGVVNLDPAGRVDRSEGRPAEFEAAVEGVKAALVGVMAQAAVSGGPALAGVLAAVPLQEGVIAVLVRRLNRQKDGSLVAWVSEPGVPEVRYEMEGMCFIAAAAVRGMDSGEGQKGLRGGPRTALHSGM